MSSHQPFLFQSGIRDNRERGSVGEFLRENIKSDSKLLIVSAYFTIYAFQALKKELLSIEQLDFLFGEPRFIQAIGASADRKAFKIEDTGIELSERLKQSKLAKECEKWLQDKVNIRSIKQANLLHGKMYYIGCEQSEKAILGSSNFTVRGLGLANGENNIELNLEVDSDRDRRDLKSWFNELWNNETLVENVKDEVISYLNKLYQDNTPEFIYYKTLFHLFINFLEEQEKNNLLTQQQHLIDTKIWHLLYDFQKDGVRGAINKILAHNGCIIADSVGLGKTFEALAVIKYFELRNDKVLVLCPKKLRNNWTVYHASNNSELNILIEDRFSYTVLSHTDLSREVGYSGDINLETLNWGNYDLIVIDESHNFRNNTKGKGDKRSRYERLMQDIIQAGIPTKVLLLSATPVNTDLKDLRNQINFITEDKDDAFHRSLGIGSIKQTLKTAQQEFTKWTKNKQHDSNKLLENLSSSFFTLLDGLTIARSRQHIQKYYQEEVEVLGGFPERLKPISIFSSIDLEDSFMNYDDINNEISSYQLSLFNPSRYILSEYQDYYESHFIQGNFTQSNRENYLIGMMKVNFLKRLESSVYSFKITLERTIEKIKKLEAKIHNFQQYQTQIIAIESDDLEIEPFDDEELQAAFEVGKDLKYQLKHLNVGQWLQDLSRDRKQLNKLYLQAKDVDVTRDAKLDQLKHLIANKINHPTINKQGWENRKVLIFTAFADTAIYLYEALKDWVKTELVINLALVTGGNGSNQATFGSTNFDHILTNFSPRAKKRDKMPSMPQEGEIDLLIATDCISEGQNLQDCDYLINYDIHWNPVRIIQRFGRIDRIGSINQYVQLVNFWPTDDLNKYINLKNRVEARMALVDITATGEDNLLNVSDLEELIIEDISYRDQQLLRLKDEVLDLEDINETISLTEFTLDDFRVDLLNYLQRNRQALEEASLGLYAVVPPHPDYEVIQPGIIFCLQQIGNTSGNEMVNPLQPYFLVYVRDDREVRYTFAQPKQILEIYRLLCSGKTQPYQELCHLFNQQTDNDSSMKKQTELLEKAIDSITRTFTKRMAKNLFKSGKEGLIPKQTQQVTKTTDFELVTWLVIKDESDT